MPLANVTSWNIKEERKLYLGLTVFLIRFYIYKIEQDIAHRGRIILKWVFKKWEERCMAEDRDRWRVFVNEGMNLGVAYQGQILDYLRTCYLVRKDSAPWS